MAKGTGTGVEGARARGRRDERMLDRLRALAEQHDLDAYLVGGAVRDLLSDRPFHDPDVVVFGVTLEELQTRLDGEGKLSPLEITRVEEGESEPIRIGWRLTAPWGPADGIELALARTEVSTGGGHKDFAIELDPNATIEADLARRDFTINAMACSLRSGALVDPYGGRADLAAGVLRAVSDSSFQEDPLRILRALPRMAKDGLTPDAATADQMRAAIPLLRHISAERVREELDKTLMGPEAARALAFAAELGLLSAPEVLPEFAPCIGYEQGSEYHSLPLDEHLLLVVERACALDASLAVRWAALLHDLGKPEAAWVDGKGRSRYYANPADPAARSHEAIGADIARRVMRRLRQPDELTRTVSMLVSEHMFRDNEGGNQPLRARRFLARIGRDRAPDLLALRRADHGAKDDSGLHGPALAAVERFESHVAAQWQAPIMISELAVNGNDVLAFGFRGPAIGAELREVLDKVIAHPATNERARQLDWLARAAVRNGFIRPDEAEAVRATLDAS